MLPNWKTKTCCTEVKSLDLVIENFRFQVSGIDDRRTRGRFLWEGWRGGGGGGGEGGGEECGEGERLS